MKLKHVALLSTGHLVTDISQGALPALLPFFIAAHGLSYTAAAGMVFALNMSSTIIQPLFGHAADRFSKPWFLLLGMLLSGFGLSLTGIAPSYFWIFVLSILSGIGIAAYHPEAARRVHFLAGDRKATAMSIFGIGGNIGFAVGPIFATAIVAYWNLRGTLFLFVPALVVSIIMATQLSNLTSFEKSVALKKSAESNKHLLDAWAPFIRLTLTVIIRSVVMYGLNTFIPLYWIHVLHKSEAAGALALTVYGTFGVIGNFLGGNLADRFGQKKVILSGFLGLTLLFPAFVWVDTTPLAMLCLILISLSTFCTQSPTIVLGQKYLPNHIGLSAGVTIGIAISIGGAATPVIGKIADLHGIHFALACLAVLPVILAGLALTLPDPHKTQ